MKTLSKDVLKQRWDLHRRSFESDVVARDEAKEATGAEEFCSLGPLILSFVTSDDEPSEVEMLWFIFWFCLQENIGLFTLWRTALCIAKVLKSGYPLQFTGDWRCLLLWEYSQQNENKRGSE